MTIPNTLPVRTQDINKSGFPHEEKQTFSSCFSNPGMPEDLAMIVTTPSSIIEHPLLSAGNPKRAKLAWYKQVKPPYAMLIISCVQVGLYVCLDDVARTRALQILFFDPRKQKDLWRFLSYMLMHKDEVHLVQNVLLQCLFGIYLETFEGSCKVLMVYMGGGVGGALGAATICGDLIVGASAGVYALLLSYVSHITLNYNTMKYKLYLLISVGVIIISDIVYCAFHYFYNASPTISGGAHLFGALFGLLLGLILFSTNKSLYKESSIFLLNYNKLLAIIAFSTLLLVFIVLVSADIKSRYALIMQSSKVPDKLEREFASH